MKAVQSGLTAVLLTLTGCAASTPAADGVTPSPGAAGVSATIRDAAGRSVGTARIEPGNIGLRVRLSAAGLAPGTYGTHIHSVGLCEPPAFTTAGAHWNPTARQHGRDNPQGAHFGDLPNLVVDASGHGQIEFTIDGTLESGANPLLDADGAAIVVHAQADDYRTDPSGNSGARIACGVFSR
jgi:Cu-Zn family superoxide dismutase